MAGVTWAGSIVAGMFQHTLVLAASSDPGSKIGKNLGDMLQGFAIPVYLGILAVVVIAYMSDRKLNKLAVFLIGALGIGIVVMDSAAVTDIVKSVGDAIAKGV